MLTDKNYARKLQCVFCNAELFELPEENYQPEIGDMIRCANCGRLNDYSSIRNLAINKTLKNVEKDIKDEMEKMFKKAGFKIK